MESTLAVVLCACVGLLLAYQAHALPKPSEDIPDTMVGKPFSKDALASPVVAPEEASITEDVQSKTPEEREVKKESTVEKGEKTKAAVPAAAKLNVRFPEESKHNVPVKEDDEIVRSKKSASMRDMQFGNGPHTTTVCIQVRSDHQPKVVCGPQVEEETKPSAAARFAYPSAGEFIPVRIGQEPQQFQPQQQLYLRVNPEDLSPARASGRAPQTMMAGGRQQLPLKFVQSGPSAMPARVMPGPARGSAPQFFPMRRSEEELPAQKPVEAPVQPAVPVRLLPQAPAAAGPVVVHRQYYQPIPVASNMIAPPPSPLRLNCAVQPEGQFLQPYVAPVLRTASPAPTFLPGYYPLSEQLVTVDPVSRLTPASQSLDGQYYIDSSGDGDSIVSSPYTPMYSADGYSFTGDDGQTYRMAEDGQSFLRKSPSTGNPMTMEELKTITYEQEKELNQSIDKLHHLQQQLKDIQQRVNVEEEKKDSKKSMTHGEHQKDSPYAASAPADQQDKKEPLVKPTKRQAHKIKGSS